MTVKQVRTRAVTAHAVEFTCDNHDELADFVPGHVQRGPAGETQARGSHEGAEFKTIQPGHHVVKHADGSHHVVPAASYHAHFEDAE